MAPTPPYVEFGGLASAPGPLQCDDTTLYVFALQADAARLDTLCRRVFAGPTGGAVDYRPLGDHVLLTFGVVGAIRPVLEPWHSMGAVREPQVGFWIPVARVRADDDGDLVGERFGMFCAAMMLDNPISLLSGREDYGYPKTMGWSTMPDGDLADPFTLEVFGMDFGGGQAPARRPLMELRPAGDELGEADLALGDMLEVGQWIRDVLFAGPDRVALGLRFAMDFAQDLRAHRVDQVFLKQVRATEDGRRADLQQVVVAPAVTRNVRATQLRRDYDLTLHHLDSHPLGDELGLTDQRVTLAARLDFDFLIEAGTVAWAART
ncbi:hypothetical protein FSW04_24720 [Baekduia soli]|uniref:Acetoacetate decarboxylase n=1 Tax=Baekduia soli TaxID=496014 RepID=A0A5B8UBD0_9ACTN|nr:hypothetical protein [Baekduia soli]QEC50466.1 hypothetical protein FSW04_24720 [Baekduia soli]